MQTPSRRSRYTVLGLTGSIGSGKSTVASMLRRLGARIIDADVLARQAVAPGTAALCAIRRVFGAAVFLPSGRLNRRALADVIFSSPAKRRILERIIHPAVRTLFKRRLAAIKRTRSPRGGIIVYVVPLLFESHEPYPEIQLTVVVYTPLRLAITRTIARDGCTKTEALRRYRAQMPIREKLRRADFVIKNTGTLATLRQRTRELYERLTRIRSRLLLGGAYTN